MESDENVYPFKGHPLEQQKNKLNLKSEIYFIKTHPSSQTIAEIMMPILTISVDLILQIKFSTLTAFQFDFCVKDKGKAQFYPFL